jgi:hypothetical protein
MLEDGHSGMQIQKLLSAFPPSEFLLRSLVASCGSVFLLNGVSESSPQRLDC